MKVHFRRARFPPVRVEAEPHSPVASIGRFEVPTLSRGKPITVLIDMSGWSRPRLARAFTVSLRDHLLAPKTICTRAMITASLSDLRRFWQFLDTLQCQIDDVRDLTAALLDGYETWLCERSYGVPQRRRAVLGRLLFLLRTIEEARPGSLHTETVERCAYVSLEPIPRGLPRDAYSGALADRLRCAARVQVQVAVSRITLDGSCPAVPEGVDPRLQERYADVIAKFDRYGWINANDSTEYRSLKHASRKWPGPEVRWDTVPGLFYLNPEDVIAFICLLALQTGMELHGLLALKADCLKNHTQGTVEIEYLKRRARGAEHKRLRVRDGGINTPGGLIRLALGLTARARRCIGTDALWAHCIHLGLRDHIDLPNRFATHFVQEHQLLDDDGRPLKLSFSRLRKTYKAEWYIKTKGQLDDFAVGHSVGVAAKHYADIPALRHIHEQTVAEGLSDALDDFLLPTLISPQEEAAIRQDPAGVPIPNVPEEVVAFLDGAQDVWLASCSGFYASPFARRGQPCPVPFWGCLECANAVITSRKLPAIVAFLDFIVAQRDTLSASDWRAKFGRAHQRIVEQIIPAFPEEDVAMARAVASATPALVYLPPEARAR